MINKESAIGRLATGQATATLFGHTGFVTSVAFSPGGHTLATGSWDGTIRLWTLGAPQDAAPAAT